jgi:hypothetical protein
MPVGTCFIKSPILEGHDPEKFLPEQNFSRSGKTPRAGNRPVTLTDYYSYPVVYEHFGDGRELAGLYGTRISPDYINLSALCYNLFDHRQQIRHSE